MINETFEWDESKNRANYDKHGVSFEDAQEVFRDPNRLIHRDNDHSEYEERYFCIGRIRDNILTVRFTYRDRIIRIIGAGYWRKGKKHYEQTNKQ